MSEQNPVKEVANSLAQSQDADILIYNGAMRRGFDQRVIDLCEGRQCRSNVLLFLTSQGGDAAAAYRIARCLHNKFKKFTVAIFGYCKSAGTILALGAHELVIADNGELGPLDVQLAKADDLLQSNSGLNIQDALSHLQTRSFRMFEEVFLTLTQKSGGRITTKTATHIATELVTGLYGKIYEQIDPMNLGEMCRAMKVAKDYGDRLSAKSRNLKPGAVDELTASYSDHGFVIDRQEAMQLFHRVREPNDIEKALGRLLGEQVVCPVDPAKIDFLSDQKTDEVSIPVQSTEAPYAEKK